MRFKSFKCNVVYESLRMTYKVRRTYFVVYGSVKAVKAVLDDPDTTSEVLRENQPPRSKVLLPPGRLQQREAALPCLSVREA